MEIELRIGEGGAVNRPTTYEAMESSMTLKGISEQFLLFCAEAQAKKKELTIQITGKGQDRYNSANVGNMKLVMKGYVKQNPIFSSLSAGQKAEFKLSLGVNALTQQVGETTLYFEPAANKYEINGVNKWK